MIGPSESAVVAQCLEWLALRRIFAWRNNTGACKLDGRWIRYGHPGSGDILGVLPNGLFLSVECKTPAGRQSKQQKLFQTMIEKNGGVYVVARSAADLERYFIEDPRLASVSLNV
ncbi:VRR-NUC domain-containing protein [Tundrisphaera lichenicola]|uniref:VRR-NUC domain-containing protein n=1 Tax=Tundrisphaera lichenicola TaxID=2029860 RepID=UPI003EB9C376